MAPLMSREQYPKIIISHFLAFCASHGILTAEDFILHGIYELAALAQQQPGIEELICVVDSKLHQRWLNGMELLADSLRNKHVLSAGYEGIDLLLGGGLREGQLTELFDPSSSGKTQATNHTVGGDGGAPKPALGETWKSIPDVRLMLSRDRGNNSCSVSIIKHSSMAPGVAASFTICN